MKKILTVAAFAALAFAACGDSGSNSIPTTGNPNDNLFGNPWVATNSDSERQEVIQFERLSIGENIAKMSKYVTCSNGRYSTVETNVAVGDKAITINQDVEGTDDDGCQARFEKDNYGYTVTVDTLKMDSTGEEKINLEYKRKGVYSCLMDDYQKVGRTCSDYYNDSVPTSVCANLGTNGRYSPASCAERVSQVSLKSCRVLGTTNSGKKVDLVLHFYDQKPDCGAFGTAYMADLEAQLAK